MLAPSRSLRREVDEAGHVIASFASELTYHAARVGKCDRVVSDIGITIGAARRIGLQAVAQAQARNRALFVQLDTDRNGQISQAEFAALSPPPPTAGAQQMLTRMDSNRDSQISQVEYRASTLFNFDRLDANKDGYVSPDEMKAGGIVQR